MPRRRDYIPLEQKLASMVAIFMLAPEHVKELRERKAPARDVLRWVDWDHAHLHSFGGSDRWHNLWCMIFAPHVIKSRADAAAVAKAKRIDKRERGHRRAIAQGRKPKRQLGPRRRWPKRSFGGR